MSELRDRMSQDLQLAGLGHKGTDKVYLRAVPQLAGFYMRASGMTRSVMT